MHKDHILQVVLGTNGWGLSVDTGMIIQSCIVEDMMMMSSYLYDDRLFRAYVDWCRSSLLMILGPCRSGWLWCFSHMIEWFYILCKRMSWWGHTLMIHASCWSSCCWQILWSRSYSVVADIYLRWLVFSHDVIVCLYCSHLFRSCNDLCWFPHYAWDEWCYHM